MTGCDDRHQDEPGLANEPPHSPPPPWSSASGGVGGRARALTGRAPWPRADTRGRCGGSGRRRGDRRATVTAATGTPAPSSAPAPRARAKPRGRREPRCGCRRRPGFRSGARPGRGAPRRLRRGLGRAKKDDVDRVAVQGGLEPVGRAAGDDIRHDRRSRASPPGDRPRRGSHHLPDQRRWPRGRGEAERDQPSIARALGSRPVVGSSRNRKKRTADRPGPSPIWVELALHAARPGRDRGCRHGRPREDRAGPGELGDATLGGRGPRARTPDPGGRGSRGRWPTGRPRDRWLTTPIERRTAGQVRKDVVTGDAGRARAGPGRGVVGGS